MQFLVRLLRHIRTEMYWASQNMGKNCGVTILIVSLFTLCRLRITTQFRFGTVDKMAGIFTKHIWQPYLRYIVESPVFKSAQLASGWTSSLDGKIY